MELPSHLQVLRDLDSLRAVRDTWYQKGLRVAFVPTMGNLHEGHFSLVRLAKQHADVVVVSVFVNPTQFGRGEDFDQYPRTLEQDVLALTLLGVDVVFAPSVAQMYPDCTRMADELPAMTSVVPPSWLTDTLCGAKRPGHFTGVATVVTKLLNMVQPHVAVFGQKDYQQVAIIRHCVRDLNLPVQVLVAPTGRAEDGLALSSRNQYLTPHERALAPRLYQVLLSIADRLKDGDTDYENLCKQAKKSLVSMGLKEIDYVEIRNPESLTLSQAGERAWVVLLAVRLGKTRLIDNIVVEADGLA